MTLLSALLRPTSTRHPHRLCRATPWLAVALSAVVLLTATGCADGARRVTLPRSVDVDVISVPSEMTASEMTAQVGGEIAPATDDLPYAIGGSSGKPGEPSAPTVWTSLDGLSWKRTTITGVTGSFTGTLVASTSVAVLVGELWDDGLTTAAAWQSTDRETWERVEIPMDLAATTRIDSASADGDRVVTIGTDFAGEETTALSIQDGVATSLRLPQPRKGERLNADSIVRSPTGLLLIASPGPEGESAAPVAYLSENDGKKWSKRTPISTDSTATISGGVWTGTDFVATGFAHDPDAGHHTAAVWSSLDGRTWLAETVELDNRRFNLGYADSWLGAPSATGGSVTALGSGDNNANSAIFSRGDDAVWRVSGVTDNNSTTGATGMTTAADGMTIAVISGAGRVRSGRLEGQLWESGENLSERQDVPSPVAIHDGGDGDGDGAAISLTAGVFSTEGSGWYRSSAPSAAEFDGKASVTMTALSPQALDDANWHARGTSDDGAEVSISETFDTDTGMIRARPFFRESAKSEWVEGSGFPADGATSIRNIEHFSDGWIALGLYRGRAGDQTEFPVMWTSTDGVVWAQQTGEFGSEESPVIVYGLCALSDGSPLAVGTARDSVE